MANYKYSSDLVDDILFRVGEKTDGNSDFEATALRYLNRAYQTVWMGGTEFVPEINETWWWLRTEGVIIMNQPITTGTVSVTNGSTSATLSAAPSSSVEGWFFKTDDDANVFRIAGHTGGSAAITLDAAYTGDTDTAAGFKLVKLEYNLSGCIKIADPMVAYKDNRNEITGMSSRKMDLEFPLNHMEAGVPSRFAMTDEDTVRFNRYGSTDATNGVRIDYNYIKRPDDLTNSGSEEPLVPLEYRRVLSDIATFWLMGDKNDDRADGVGRSAKALLKAMSIENRSRWANWGDYAMIKPRASSPERMRPLRTETGVIIG